MVDGADAGEQDRKEAEQPAFVTRSEEELRVITRRRVIGRVRLQKVIVDDEVTVTVPIRREELRVAHEEVLEEEEPTQSGGELGEGERVIVLREEVPVVTTEAVPRKRVRVTKEVEVEHRRISDTIDKEQVATEGVPASPRRGQPG